MSPKKNPRNSSQNRQSNKGSGSRTAKRPESKGSSTAGRGTAVRRQTRPQDTARSRSGNTGDNKIVTYQKPVNINIGVIIFAVILIYVLYSVFRYATAKHVVGYEVRTGSISTNQVYQGLALRTEEVVSCESSGYINYYSPETDRLAVGKLAYTIDESGQVQSYLAQSAGENSVLTESDYSSIASDIVSFGESFCAADYQQLYEFKTSLTGTIQKLASRSILSDLTAQSYSSLQSYYTTSTGYIVYCVDGYEDKTFEELVTSDFDTTSYSRTELTNGNLVTQGDPAYRIETAEDWEVAIQTASKEDAQMLQEEGVVKVRFLKNQYEAWATVGEIRDPGDGNYLVQLKFTNSMMAFCTDRFLSIEILMDTTEGLKVPKSALIDDTFYVVPKEYVTTGVGGSEGVLRQIMDSDGEKSTEFISVTPYTKDEDEENYYLDQQTLRDGDVLVKPDSTETLTLANSMTDTLTGVYNINKGYADFRQVTKISENDEYAIVKANSTYGLREYDYIVLNANTMSPNEFLYE